MMKLTLKYVGIVWWLSLNIINSKKLLAPIQRLYFLSIVAKGHESFAITDLIIFTNRWVRSALKKLDYGSGRISRKNDDHIPCIHCILWDSRAAPNSNNISIDIGLPKVAYETYLMWMLGQSKIADNEVTRQRSRSTMIRSEPDFGVRPPILKSAFNG